MINNALILKDFNHESIWEDERPLLKPSSTFFDRPSSIPLFDVPVLKVRLRTLTITGACHMGFAGVS
jgi:hypothetical protein